jgi:membrane fusion protein (multidrug efflux system)
MSASPSSAATALSPNSAEKRGASSSSEHKRLLPKVALWIALPAALVWAGTFVHHLLTHEETDDAYVTGAIHTISSRLPGVVETILVKENDTVSAGQPILSLDPRDLQLQLDRARASLEQAKAGLSQAEAKVTDAAAQDQLVHAGIELAKANVTRDEAGAAEAETDFTRVKRLMSENGRAAAISQADYDHAETALRTANATLAATHASLEAARAYVASVAAKQKAASAEREAAQAEVRSAEVAVRDAELQLSYTTIKAPIAGRISRKSVETGDRIQAGQAVFALVDPEVWVEANFKETQLARLKLGAPVDLTIDAMPGRSFRGRVESFAPASGAQFALLPPDNASGNFTKVVQRVPVKILFESGELDGVREQVRPGLSVVVSIPL